MKQLIKKAQTETKLILYWFSNRFTCLLSELTKLNSTIQNQLNGRIQYPCSMQSSKDVLCWQHLPLLFSELVFYQ